jgi:hypothetical protein
MPSIVGGLDIHRKQITFDCLDLVTGEVNRGRIAPADRAHPRSWLPASATLVRPRSRPRRARVAYAATFTRPLLAMNHYQAPLVQFG